MCHNAFGSLQLFCQRETRSTHWKSTPGKQKKKTFDLFIDVNNDFPAVVQVQTFLPPHKKQFLPKFVAFYSEEAQFPENYFQCPYTYSKIMLTH